MFFNNCTCCLWRLCHNWFWTRRRRIWSRDGAEIALILFGCMFDWVFKPHVTQNVAAINAGLGVAGWKGPPFVRAAAGPELFHRSVDGKPSSRYVDWLWFFQPIDRNACCNHRSNSDGEQSTQERMQWSWFCSTLLPFLRTKCPAGQQKDK